MQQRPTCSTSFLSSEHLDAPINGKVTLCKCLIVGTLLAGIATLSVKPADLTRLQSAMLRIGLRLLGRRGYRRVRGSSIDNDDTDDKVLKMLKLEPVWSMLRQRRIMYFRGVIGWHKHRILATLL